MKNKFLSLIGVAALALAAVSIPLITGCASAPPAQQQAVNVAAVTLASSALTSGDLVVRPGDLPAIQGAQAVICAISGDSAAVPGQINAALYNLGLGGKIGTIAQAEIPNVINLISLLEAGNPSSTNVQAIAGAFCNGITQGITSAQSHVAN